MGLTSSHGLSQACQASTVAKMSLLSALTRATSQVRDAITLAGDQARKLGARPPGTQHLLLALAEQEEGRARLVLAELNVFSEAVAQSLLSLPTAESATAANASLSREAEGVLAAANAYSHRRQDHYLGTPHVLRAIADSDGCLGQAVLLDIGVDLERLAGEVDRSLSERPEAQRDWAVVIQNAEKRPLLGREDELELARLVRAGRTALETLNDEHGRSRSSEFRTLDPALWRVVEQGWEASGRLMESNYRLLVEIGELYEKDGHDPFWVWQRASRALDVAVTTWTGDPDERFRQHAWPLLLEQVDADLERRESL